MTKPSEPKTASKTEEKTDAAEVVAAARAPERSYRDPRCEEQKRHISMCDCAGEARLPIA